LWFGGDVRAAISGCPNKVCLPGDGLRSFRHLPALSLPGGTMFAPAPSAIAVSPNRRECCKKLLRDRAARVIRTVICPKPGEYYLHHPLWIAEKGVTAATYISSSGITRHTLFKKRRSRFCGPRPGCVLFPIFLSSVQRASSSVVSGVFCRFPWRLWRDN